MVSLGLSFNLEHLCLRCKYKDCFKCAVSATHFRTKDLLVYCAAGLPSYRLKIPLRFYWVYKGYRTIDLESDPYRCFLGSLTTIQLL